MWADDGCGIHFKLEMNEGYETGATIIFDME